MENNEYKKIKPNSRKINRKSKIEVFEKILSAFFDVFIIFMFCVFAVFCFCSIFAKIKRRPCVIFGSSFMVVASGSMENSGFYKGDVVSVRAVDTDSLKPGDIIAFYVYRKSYENYDENKVTQLQKNDFASEIKYLNPFTSFLGEDNKDINQASSLGKALVFHMIDSVYEDEYGDRWFKTYGTSNDAQDLWIVKETLIFGAYDDSFMPSVVANVISIVSSGVGFYLCVVLPLIVFLVVQAKQVFGFISLLSVEQKLMSGELLLTDEECVKNKVGFKLGEKEKLKVLANAPNQLKMQYASLLWEGSNESTKYKCFLKRKKLLSNYYAKMEGLKQECNLLMQAGGSEKEIRKYYNDKKQKLKQEQKKINKRLKIIAKNNKKNQG